MVDLALSSTALLIFSHTQQYAPASTEASSRYDRLLRVAQKRIAQMETSILDERNVDSSLLAVFLMGRYEGATYRPCDLNVQESFTSLQVWSHHDGAMAILKLWKNNPSPKPATSIVKQTRRCLIKSLLIRNLPLPDWMLDGSRFGERNLELDYDRILVRTVELHYASERARLENVIQVKKAEELNTEARELDQALQNWASRFPSTWSYQRHSLLERDGQPRRGFYSPTVYSYSSSGHTAVWCQYFATRMLINNTRLKILDMSPCNVLIHGTYEQQLLECTSNLQAMADSLASTIPFCLERVKVRSASKSSTCQPSITLNTNEEVKPYLANLVVWPLTIASSLEGIDFRQQLWFRSELARLGRLLGLGVLECAETEQWTTL